MTLGEVWYESGDSPRVWDGSGDPRGGPGRVEERYRRFWTGRETLRKVRDGLREPLGGSGRVGGPSWRSGTGRVNPPKGPGRVERPSGRAGTDWGTLPEVPDSLGTLTKVRN